jgi:hypothetical protein
MTDLLHLRNIKSSLHKSIDLTCLNDERLSAKARFLFYLLSTQSENYKINSEVMMKRSKLSRVTYYKTIKELILYGYVYRAFEKNENGKIGKWILFTFEKPMTLDQVKETLGNELKSLIFK